MKNLSKFIALIAILLIATTSASAQSVLGKVLDQTGRTVDIIDGVDAVSATMTDKEAIDWENIPIYSIQKVAVTDSLGNSLLNEDGTDQYRYLLVDQNGNRRSAKAVKQQQKALLKAAGGIVKKVGFGALLGGLTNGVQGAITGAASGALNSTDEMKVVKRQHSSLKKQKKLLEAYSKNFTDEGKALDAKVNLQKIKDLNLSKAETITLSETEVSSITSDPSYSDASLKGLKLEDVEI